MLTGHRTPILMTYDANDCLVKEHHTIPGGSREVIRAYDKDSRETSVTCGSAKVEKAFDELGRLLSIKRNGGKHVTEFTYGAGLTESETKAESTESTPAANVPEPISSRGFRR